MSEHVHKYTGWGSLAHGLCCQNKTKKEKKDPNAIELNKKGGFKAYGHGYPIPHVVHEDGLCMLSGVATLGSGKLGTLPHKCWPKTGGVILPVLIHRKTADLTGHVEVC